MFAYCLNSPVSHSDSSGYISYTCFGDEFLLSDQMLNVDGSGGIERPTIATSQQASKELILQETQRMKPVAYVYPIVKAGIGMYKIATGFAILAIPWPGLADEIKAWNNVRKGFGHIIDAIDITWDLLGGNR